MLRNLPTSLRLRHTLCGLALSVLLVAPASASAAVDTNCSRVASPAGSDAAAGSDAQPFRTAQKLADSLSAGQVGCLRAGNYAQSVTVSRGGQAGQPLTLRSYAGEKATLTGRLWVKKGANFVVIEDLWLDGRNSGNLPSPTVNANDVVFRRNDVTNQHTAICFVLGASDVDSSASYGRAARPVIENNRIHNCGKLPAANHDHGIYVEGADNAQIRNNWIYDNADRGIQLYPDAQGTQITGNVIDGNGSGLIFSGDGGFASSSTSVRGNIITRSKIRFNVESWYPTGNPKGQNNQVTGNCLHAPARTDSGPAGIDTSEGGFSASANTTADPRYLDPAGHDYRLRSDSPCRSLYSADPNSGAGPGSASAGSHTPVPPADSTDTGDSAPTKKKRKASSRRRISLSLAPTAARRLSVSRGGALRLQGRVSHAAGQRLKPVAIQVQTRGGWRAVTAVTPAHNGRFSARFKARAAGAGSVLRVRAFARGIGNSRTLQVAVNG